MAGTVYLGCLIIIGSFALVLGILACRKRDATEARWLAMLMFAMTIWTFMQSASLLSQSTGYKVLFHDLMFIGICLVPVSVFLFVLDYYNLLKHMSIPMRTTLFIIPLITVCLIATNPYHHLFYHTLRFFAVGNHTLVSGTYNIWFWIHSTYSYLLILSAVLVILYHLRNESGKFRHQSLLLVAGILGALFINMLTISGIITATVDLTPFTFVLVAMVFCQSLFHTRAFEIGPITKDLLYDTIYDGLMIVGSSGTIIEHNRAFLRLFSRIPGQVIGKDAAELFNDMGYSGEAILNTLHSPFCLLSGTSEAPQNLLITAIPLKGNNDAVSSILYLFRDVTEIDQRITEANQSLKTTVKARESITRNLSDMSHEIRTPLMGILGAAHQLKSDACDEEQASDAAELLSGAEELLETINRILDFSKLEAGKMNAHHETFPLENYLEALDGQKHPEITWTATGELLKIHYLRGDRHHLIQLLHLVHAFLESSGTELLHMVLDYEKGYLTQTLHFQIMKHDARELLEHWNQLGGYLTKPWNPDPITLVLAQKLAKFMDARISLERLDFEWALRLEVPLEEAMEEAILSSPSPDESEKAYHLLFAEDSIINQAVIKRMLKALPWTITFASNGMEALELAQKEVYDSIFTDVHMPGLGGIELSYRLKETINCDTPVFALTSDTDAELQEAVEESPIRALLVKPCPKEKLIQLLRENPRICKDSE